MATYRFIYRESMCDVVSSLMSANAYNELCDKRTRKIDFEEENDEEALKKAEKIVEDSKDPELGAHSHLTAHTPLKLFRIIKIW